MPKSQQNMIGIIQQIALDRFGIIISTERAKRLLSHQFTLWSTRTRLPIMTILHKVQQNESDCPMVKEFISYITVGESYFLRHQEQLDALVSWIKNNIQHPVRIWCAACSIGCEAYSLAYLLTKAGIAYHILGTDIDLKRLNIANNGGPYGRYTLRSKNVDYSNLLKLKKEEYWIDAALRTNVHFTYHNLQHTEYPKTKITYNGNNDWDIIICRNAFIYFSQDQARKILQQMATVLSNNGSIWVGVNDIVFDTHNIMYQTRWQNHLLLQKSNFSAASQPIIPISQIKLPSVTKLSIPRRSVTMHQIQQCIQKNYHGIAKDMLIELLQSDSNNLQILLTLSSLFIQEHKLEQAASILVPLSSKHTNNPEFWYFIGLIEYSLHNITQATTAFAKVIELDTNHWASLVYLGTILIKKRLWLQAEVHFEEAKRLLQNNIGISFSSLVQPQGFHEDPIHTLEYVHTQLSRLQ